MDRIITWLDQMLHLGPQLQRDVVKSIIALLAIWAVRRLVTRLIVPRIDDPQTRYHWRKGSGYLAGLLAVLLVGRIWFEGFDSIATYLGLLSSGLAVALREPIENFAGWLFILWRRPFWVGDRIQIGPIAGDVVDVRLFQFSLMEIGNWVDADQNTGRVVHVPNGMVFNQAQANYTQAFPFIWNELAVPVTFESDWRRAKRILETLVENHAGAMVDEAQRHLRESRVGFLMHLPSMSPTVYTSVEPRQGVILTLRYLVDPRQRRASTNALWEAILDAVAGEPCIELAYPVQRLFRSEVEGKIRPEGGDAAPIDDTPRK